MHLLEKLPDLISLRAISNGALKGGALPSRLKLLNWGRNNTVKGPVFVSDASVAAFSANQKALGFERVALDFEHNTVPGSPEYERSQEPRDIAAQFTPRIVPGEGLFAEDITWLTGADVARKYEDLSPAIKPDEQGNVIFMHSTALTRNGAVEGLHFFTSGGGGSGTVLKGNARMAAAFQRDYEARQARDVRRYAADAAQVGDDRTVEQRKGNAIDSWQIPDARLPKEVKIIPWGSSPSSNCTMNANQRTADLCSSNSPARIPILLPAVSDGGDPNGQNESTLADEEIAGTGRLSVRAGDGVYLTGVTWTDAGKKALLTYSDLIPKVMFAGDGTAAGDRSIIGVVSVTLSNSPGLVAQEFPRFIQLSAPRALRGIARMTAGFEAEIAARKGRRL